MANTVTILPQINGSRIFAYKIDIEGDGSGEETATVIVDASTLTGSPTSLKICTLQWAFEGFSAELLWDATTDVHAFTMPEGTGGIRFNETGAHLTNNAGAGKTGDILITTSGLGAAGHGTLIIGGIHA